MWRVGRLSGIFFFAPRVNKEGQEKFPTLHIGLRLISNYSWGGLEPSVAQPPLPLQEFLPLQPLSLALQPPLPLQEF